MFRSIRKFASSPIGRRVLMWLAPIVVGWIVSKLQSSPTSKPKSGRKSVKNKAK